MLKFIFRHSLSILFISPIAMVFIITFTTPLRAATEIQFNTDVLDIKDRNNFDLSQFSRKGFILPGTYTLAININASTLPEQPIHYYPAEKAANSTLACITPEVVSLIGFKEEALARLTWWHQSECLDFASIEGITARTDLGKSILFISIPQAYLAYSSPNWDPPARWEDGLSGFLFDYNVNVQSLKQNTQGAKSGTHFSGNGTTGINVDAWRFRADWQGRYDRRTAREYGVTPQSWGWNRFYAYRALRHWGAKLSAGEDYLNSNFFDSFRFTGISLSSDDNMLPPNLRGYAPEISGVARSNATVIISQQGRIIKEVQVPAGPYRIQDLDSAVSGHLDVRVEEQDGDVQQYQVNTATVPYLTRPGQFRYKTAVGKPSDLTHHIEGPAFATGEFSWGVNNGWSMYGGAMGGGDYHALSLGTGRDLLALGALSTDVTLSKAKITRQETQHGHAWRVSYAKHFEQTGSQVTFAGYRFSDSGFRSMRDYLNTLKGEINTGRNKEMYTLSLNQQFESLNLTTYLNYNHQTFWNQETNDRYDFSLSKHVDVGHFKNTTVSLTAYRNQFNHIIDNGMYMSLSLPWGKSGTASYNGSYGSGNTLNNVSYYSRVNNTDSYQINAGVAQSGIDVGGYYTHKSTHAQFNTSASYREGQYHALGLSLQGGATLTPQGGALHSGSLAGGTRMLVDTEDVANVPISGVGHAVRTNPFGKAIIADVSSYYRNSIRINVDMLDDNMEATKSVVQGTLTEGAIGYRSFSVISGEKSMAVIRLADGSAPPFGASVVNKKNQETGIINDQGSVYLSGIQPGEFMTLRWNNEDQCRITLPHRIPASMTTHLLLPCV